MVELREKMFKVVEAVGRIEGKLESLAEKADVGLLSQKLEDHIKVEDRWRKEDSEKHDRHIAWWQVIVASLASSGIVVWLLELFRGKPRS